MNYGRTLKLRESRRQFINESGTEQDAIDVGVYNRGYWYLNLTQLSGATVTVQLRTAARNRFEDYFDVTGAVFELTTTTKTWMMVNDFGRYLLLESQVGSGESATWESLWVPKFGDTAP